MTRLGRLTWIAPSAVLVLAAVALLPSLAPPPAVAGDLIPRVDPASYLLPAPADTRLFVTQGNDTGDLGGDHTAIATYAYDLVGADDPAFRVAAARPGIVGEVRSDVPDGNCPDLGETEPPACAADVNYLVIDHLDGTAALYLHLAEGSTGDLASGDPVVRGQRIGTAGTSGWVDAPQLHFMVMSSEITDPDAPSWWRQSIGPIAFRDPSVRRAHPDGVPGDGLTQDGPYISINQRPPTAAAAAIPRPPGLPARVPWATRASHLLAEPLPPDGFGFDVVGSASDGDPVTSDTVAYPLFGGTVRYVGCATGPSAHLGRIVVVERTTGGHAYQAVHAHLSAIDPELAEAWEAFTGVPLEPEPSTSPSAGPDGVSSLSPSPSPSLSGSPGPSASPEPSFLVPPAAVTLAMGQPIGSFGSTLTAEDGTCDEPGDGPIRLHVELLQDALVGPAGQIVGGTPVRSEPLQGSAAYRAFPWWSGPMKAIDIGDAVGAPAGNWSDAATAHRSHVPYGDPVDLVLRVRDRTDLREVRFLVTYPDWPARGTADDFSGLDPDTTWRLVAVCRPEGLPGIPRTTRGCTWDGDLRRATVRFRWDPTDAESEGMAPWLPPARAAIGPGSDACVPVSIRYEISDASGFEGGSAGGNVVRRCDPVGGGIARTVALDPPPPAAPGRARVVCSQEGELGCVGFRLRWVDRADAEDGYRIYAVDNELWQPVPMCGLIERPGPYLVATVPAGTESWDVDIEMVDDAVPDAPDGHALTTFRLAVSAYRDELESPRRVASGEVYIGGDISC